MGGVNIKQQNVKHFHNCLEISEEIRRQLSNGGCEKSREIRGINDDFVLGNWVKG